MPLIFFPHAVKVVAVWLLYTYISKNDHIVKNFSACSLTK